MRYFSLFSGVGGFDHAKKLYESGMTQAEVAKKVGTTQKMIWRLFKDAGYKCRPARKRRQSKNLNDNWKDEDAGYAACHIRVEKERGKPKWCAMCERTDRKRYEWANLTGWFTNVADYIRLCVQCHRRFDRSKKKL